MLCDALTASLTKPAAAGKASSLPGEEEKPVVDKRGRYATVLLACASFGDEGPDKTAREVLIVDWMVLAHHPAICTSLFALSIAGLA